MSLEVGAATLAGLKHGPELGEQLNTIIASAVQTATTGETEGKPQSNAAYKEAFASCLTLLFESARHDAGVSEITAVLEDASWPSDSIAQFTQLYTQHKDALRHGARVAATPLPALGSLSSTSFPSIIDVSWRVDDYLRSDALDQVRLPNYLVTLTTTNTAQPNQTTQTNQVPFACNFQQLQDLLAKLKDAQKQIQQRVE